MRNGVGEGDKHKDEEKGNGKGKRLKSLGIIMMDFPSRGLI